MAFELDGKFEWFLERWGEPTQYEAVSQETLDKYKGKLPDRLLEYWVEYGFCSFMDGLFFMVNPQEYQGVMETWLEGRGIMEEDSYHVIARTGFGDLLLWGEKTGSKYTIEPKDGVIFQESGDEKQIFKGEARDAMEGFFCVQAPNRIDLEDVDTDKLIFSQAVKQFGALAPDEMFAFVPAIFAGGEQTIVTVDKVNLFVQLEILAQMSNREIQDIHGLAKQAFGSE